MILPGPGDTLWSRGGFAKDNLEAAARFVRDGWYHGARSFCTGEMQMGTRKREALLPGEKVLDQLDPEEVFGARGGILYVEKTPGVLWWMRLVDGRGTPPMGRDVVTVLSGKRNRDTGGLGVCFMDRMRGEKYAVILLDDPDPDELYSISMTYRHYTPRTHPWKLLRRLWDAYLLHTWLHELGHVRHFLKNGRRGSEANHEDKAEKFAWRWMERIFPPKVISGVLGLMWMAEDTEG